MKTTHLSLFLALLAIPTAGFAAGFAHNENFMVLAPDQQIADAVLARADHFRAEVARQWLGKELPPSVGAAIINVEISESQERGFTWAIDSPGRKYHKVWLTATRQRLLGSTLRHEICHVVLSTRFPGALPPWAEEGAASQSDDQARINTRQGIIDWYAQTGNWPNLEPIFEAEIIPADDQATYSVAASVTRYLLSRGEKSSFLAFAEAGKRHGWDKALATHYGIRSVGHLQSAWRTWAGSASRQAAQTKSPIFVAGTRRVPSAGYGTAGVPSAGYGTGRVPSAAHGTRRVPATLQ